MPLTKHGSLISKEVPIPLFPTYFSDKLTPMVINFISPAISSDRPLLF